MVIKKKLPLQQNPKVENIYCKHVRCVYNRGYRKRVCLFEYNLW